jgi:putative addiction module component (TIGR02574 family)
LKNKKDGLAARFRFLPFWPLKGELMGKTQDLIDEAISLPIEERALLVDSLLLSMNPSSIENDQKWAREAKKRLEELRSGKVAGLSGDEVFRNVWKRFEK